MTTQEIAKLHDDVMANIDHQRLNHAMNQLSQLIDQSGQGKLRDQLEQMKLSYGFMLQYMEKGIMDPKRDEVLEHIINTLSTLCDQSVISIRDKASPEVFHIRRRELANVTLADLIHQLGTQANKLKLLQSVDATDRDTAAIKSTIKTLEQWETNIFNKVWSAFPTTKNDAELITAFATAPETPETSRCLIVMALFLGLMKFYDETKLTLLMDIYTASQSAEVQIRAIIALLLSMNTYRSRVARSRNLHAHINAMTEVPTFGDDVTMVIYRLVGTRNTDRVTRRVTQDIMPEIIKATPDLMRKLRDKKTEMDSDEFEANPEWQQLMEDNGVAKKIEEINQLQLEGSDVFISTFSRLKTFPFFQTLSNWFLPFHSGHSVVMESFGDDEHLLRDMVSQAPFLCNSDRYSFCLTLRNVPDSQRKMMMAQSQEHLEEIKEMQKDISLAQIAKQRDTIATRCVQDLYRFFKLFSRRNEFTAVMDTEMNFTGLPFVSSFTDSEDTLMVIAEFYLNNGFDQDAINYFNILLSKQEKSDPVIQQKLGFAHERLGNIRQALKHYKHYELANDEDLWTLRHIASCYRSLKKTDKALEYYERIEQIKPGQVANALNMGHALLENGDIEEALSYYFKADLMDETKHRAWRPIAWCSFLLGNTERSLDYYTRIIETSTPSMSDYLNRGHVYLSTHMMSEAIADYRQALKMCDNDENMMRDTFMADMVHLKSRGVDELDARLVLDVITSSDD